MEEIIEPTQVQEAVFFNENYNIDGGSDEEIDNTTIDTTIVDTTIIDTTTIDNTVPKEDPNVEAGIEIASAVVIQSTNEEDTTTITTPQVAEERTPNDSPNPLHEEKEKEEGNTNDITTATTTTTTITNDGDDNKGSQKVHQIKATSTSTDAPKNLTTKADSISSLLDTDPTNPNDDPISPDIMIKRSSRAKTFLSRIRKNKSKDMALFPEDTPNDSMNAGKVKKEFTDFTNAVEPENASWSADWKARCCIRCGGRFRSLALRRHNCQTCGVAVCANCSSKRLSRYPNLRICDLCFNDNLYTSKITISLRPKPHAVKTVTMSKRGHLSTGWKRRFFLLDSNGNLTYFKNSREAGMIPVHNAQQVVDACNVKNVNWPDENSVKQGFAIVCVSRVYYVVCNSEQAWWDWKGVVAMVALLCFKCGRQCFPSNFQGADPNCIHLPEMNRLYHPECFRCDHKTNNMAHKCDLFSAGYQIGNNLLCHGHALTQVAKLKEQERDQVQQQAQHQKETGTDVAQDDGADTSTKGGELITDDAEKGYMELVPDDETVVETATPLPTPLSQQTVGKKHGRKLSSSYLGAMRQQYAATVGEVVQVGDIPKLDDDLDDSEDEDAIIAQMEPSEARAKNRSRKKSLFNRANLKSQLGETLLQCVLKGIVESTNELTLGIDENVGQSTGLSKKSIDYLAQDESQHLMQQVKDGSITVDQAVRLAKLESMESGIPQVYTLEDAVDVTESDVPDVETPQQQEQSSSPSQSPSSTSSSSLQQQPQQQPQQAVEFEFVAFEPAKFEEIRNACGVDALQYMSSFATPPSANLAGGNSGSFVKKSHDNHFIIKSIDQKESSVLLAILPKYLKHLQEFPNSLLVRFLGLYEAKIENRTISVVIMDNVLDKAGQLDINELYDLKGSFIARRTMSSKNKVSDSAAQQPGDKLVTRKDMDLVRPLIVGGRGKIIMNMQMTEDVTFLNSQGLMDYSLLVGIHNCPPTCTVCDARRVSELSPDGKVRAADITKHGIRGGGVPNSHAGAESVYFFGIIDLLQIWDGKKRMEKLAKTKVLGKDQHSISAVHPDEYAIRFLEMLTQRMIE